MAPPEPFPSPSSRTHSVLALIDASAALMLPSTLACRERLPGDSLQVALAGPAHADGAMQRLAAVLEGHGISAVLQPREETLEATVAAWLRTVPPEALPMLDVSAASGGTAARGVLALMRDAARPYTMCWFNEGTNEVHFSNGSVPEAHVIDVGCGRSVRSAITPRDFMAIFGLERVTDDPYCGAPPEQLLPIARQVLRVAMEQPDDYRQFRHLLAGARARAECLIASDALPGAMQPVVRALADVEGWLRFEGAHFMFCGSSNTRGVFLLSGGWLELVVAEAMRRALPEHHVQTNCAATWGNRRRAEAEMDVAFVFHNALYLLSCKNDHLTDRFFPHLDRFRALTAEFGESRTRPVLLSTAELEPRHIRRCDAYEIGQISGATLLQLIARSLADEPDTLLRGLLTVSRGAPRAGMEGDVACPPPRARAS